jgi:hypothetical protein
VDAEAAVVVDAVALVVVLVVEAPVAAGAPTVEGVAEAQTAVDSEILLVGRRPFELLETLLAIDNTQFTVIFGE